MDKIFLLHPGIASIGPYWELMESEDDPLIARISKGEIPKAGIVVAIPPLPPAWMPGRFFALFGPRGESDWKEVTGQVQIELFDGLARCPEWVRKRYGELATQNVT